MALNPPVSFAGIPLRVADEFILLDRDGTEIEASVQGMKTLTAKGKVYLTSARLVFVNTNFQKDHFKSFDMPIALMRDLDFKQPIFGSNYLQLTILPLYNLIPAPARIKLWFTKGGCDKFLRLFDAAKSQVATQLQQGRRTPDTQFNDKIRTGYFASNKAYQDPSDPTYVYVEQPPATFANTPADQYLGDHSYYKQNAKYPSPPEGGMTIGRFKSKVGGNGQPSQQAYVPPPQMHPTSPQTTGGMNYPEPPTTDPYQNNGQNYPQGMQNPQAALNNQPTTGYYFGVPLGPQLNQNR